MKIFDCVVHNKPHTSETGWVLKKWQTEQGEVEGWGCADVRYPEFVSQEIKNDRVTFASDMLQSHRGGNLSKEWIEAYPERTKALVKQGIITKQEVKKAKNVWGEVKGWEKGKKIDSSDLVKKL